jgi:hypothetical protein
MESIAAVGTITQQLVTTMVDTSLEDLCTGVLVAVGNNNQQEAIRLVDKAGDDNSPNLILKTLLSIYARAMVSPEGEFQHFIAVKLCNLSDVTNILLKWLKVEFLPEDSLPLMVFELLSTIDVPPVTGKQIIQSGTASGDPPLPVDEWIDMMGGIPC